MSKDKPGYRCPRCSSHTARLGHHRAAWQIHCRSCGKTTAGRRGAPDPTALPAPLPTLADLIRKAAQKAAAWDGPLPPSLLGPFDVIPARARGDDVVVWEHEQEPGETQPVVAPSVYLNKWVLQPPLCAAFAALSDPTMRKLAEDHDRLMQEQITEQMLRSELGDAAYAQYRQQLLWWSYADWPNEGTARHHAND